MSSPSSPEPRFSPPFHAFRLVAIAGLLAVAAPAPAAPSPRPHFHSARIEYEAGRGARAIATGDLDGDGNVDLAVADEIANSIVILSGDAFGAFSVAGEFPAGNAPVAIVAADLDGDEALDVAVADSVGNCVTVLRGPDFLTRTTLPVGLNPTSLVVVDIDRNGDPDLAVVNSGSLTLSLLLADGTGEFSRVTDRDLDYKAWALAAGNIDGDGIPDLLVARRSNLLPAIAGLPGRGDYESYLDFAAPAGPYAIATGDLNEDGLDDVVVATESGDLSVRMAGGPAWLGPRTDVAVGLILHGVAIADLNGDAHLDVVTCGVAADESSLSDACFVLLGDGTGALLPPYAFPTGLGVRGLATGDFDSDGALDLGIAVAESNVFSGVTVHRANGDGSFGSERFVPVPTSSIQRLAVADMDGDSLADLVAATASGTFVYPGTKDARLVEHRFNRGPTGAPFRMGDLNGDGRADLVEVRPDSIRVWLASGLARDSLVFASATRWGDDVHRPAIGDVDYDGLADVVVGGHAGVKILPGDGAGGLGIADMLPGGTGVPGGVEIVNSRAQPWLHAIAVALPWSDPEDVYLPDMYGTLWPASLDAGPGTAVLATGDVDGDGIADLVGGGRGSTCAVRMTITPPPRTFLPQPPVCTGVANAVCVRIADTDGDGRGEVVTGGFGDGLVFSIVPGHGAFEFDPRTRLRPSVRTGGLMDNETVDTGDLNGDGAADIVFASGARVGVLVAGAAATPIVDTLGATVEPEGGARIVWRLHEQGVLQVVRIQRALPGDPRWSDVFGTPATDGDLSVLEDPDATAGTQPWYRLMSDGAFAAPGPVRALPTTGPPPPPTYVFSLAPIVPNPTDGPARVDFTLPAAHGVRVEVLDLQGRRVATLVEGSFAAGPHSVVWDGRSEGGRTGAGIYFVRLVSGSQTRVQRVARMPAP